MSSCGKVLFYIVIERRREVRAVSHAERQHANLLQMALLAHRQCVRWSGLGQRAAGPLKGLGCAAAGCATGIPLGL